MTCNKIYKGEQLLESLIDSYKSVYTIQLRIKRKVNENLTIFCPLAPK